MIQIEVNHNRTKLRGELKTLNFLRQTLRVKNKNAWFLRKYMPKGWDGFMYYVTENATLHTGILPKVIELLEERKEKYEITDLVDDIPLKFVGIPKELGKFKIRGYQRDAIRAVVENQVGGVSFPRGLINAATNAGKCTGHDTILFIDKLGLVRLKELNPSLPKNKMMSIDINAKTELGFKKADTLLYSGNIKTLKIVTESGYEIVTGYHTHRLKYLSETGEIVWKYVRELKVGDSLPLMYNQQCYGVNYIKVDNIIIDEELAYVLGVLHGDGCIKDNGFNISAHHSDVEILHSVIACIENKFNIPIAKNLKRKTGKAKTQFKLSKKSNKLKSFFIHIPELIANSFNKRIPVLILQSPKSVQSAYLRGYFDTDGSCGVTTNKKRVSITSVSERGMYEVQQMLLNMGIVSKKEIKKTTWINKGIRKRSITHRLIIHDIFINAFNQEIGFQLKRKKEKLNTIYNRESSRKPIKMLPDIVWDLLGELNNRGLNQTRNHNRIKSHIPLSRFVRRKTLITKQVLNIILRDYIEFKDTKEYKLLEQINKDNLYWDTISEIIPGKEKCWDIAVPETNSYIGNGFINHNTIIAAGIYKSFKNVKALMLINDSALFSQFTEEIPQLIGKDYGGIQGKNITPGNFTVAMVQTLYRNINDFRNLLSTYDMVLVDECDLSTSKSYKTILKQLYNAKIRVGLSGTIGKHKDPIKNWEINAFFGNELYVISKQELIKRKVSAPLVIKISLGNTLIKIPGDYDAEYNTGITNSKERTDALLKRIAFNLDRGRLPQLVVAQYHEHVENLYGVISKKYPKLRITYTHHAIKNRNDIFKEFREGKIDILISSMIVKRGKNFPLIKVIYNAGGGDSFINTSQLMGRGERKDKSKTKTYFEDFRDMGRYLQRHSKHREIYYKKEGFKIIPLYKRELLNKKKNIVK